MRRPGTNLIVGTDADGDRREIWTTSEAVAVSLCASLMQSDLSGPAWKSCEVWGNDPTGDWKPIFAR